MLVYGRERQARPIPVPSSYETFVTDERIIPLLPEQNLQLAVRDLAHTIDHAETMVSQYQNRAPETRTSSSGRGTLLQASKGKYRLSKAIGRSLKHALAGYSETELNDRIWKGLRTQFNEDRVNAVIDQAFTVFYSHNPTANRPELYELYENGDLDRALDMAGLRWVIGKPKR